MVCIPQEKRIDLNVYLLLHDLERLNNKESVYKDTLLEGNAPLNLLHVNRKKGQTPPDPRQTKIFYRENENFSH